MYPKKNPIFGYESLKYKPMHCRNCSKEVHEKAVVCPGCGVHPLAETKFCRGCGIPSNPSHATCPACGVSLATRIPFDLKKLKEFDFATLKKKPVLIAAAIALICCCFSWVNMDTFGLVNTGFSLFGLAHPVALSDTILSAQLLYLLPLSLIGIIAADFVPAIQKYRKVMVITSVVMIVYAGIGLYQITNPSEAGDGGFMQMINSYDMGWGYYLTLIATAACAYFFKIAPPEVEQRVEKEKALV